MDDLPVIDVGPLVAPPAADDARPADDGDGAVLDVARRIDEACRHTGFFCITGHGVPRDLRDRLDHLARELFAQPDEVKARIAMAHGGSAWRGWFPVGGELTSGRPDRKEGLYFGAELPPDHPAVLAGRPLHGPNLFPDEPADLRDAVLEYLDRLTALGQAVLGGMALGLGLERSWFARHLTTDPVILFRIFRYPALDAGAATDPARDQEEWGVAEHTDYGLLTLLGQDGTGGLEVRTPEGWIAVDPDPDLFVCNIGDMLERLTGGRYRSTPHRVRPPLERDRLSFPFFLDPSWDAVVDRLPIVDRPTDDGAAERWDRTSVHGYTGPYGDYLLAKVRKVFPELAAAVGAGPGAP